MKYCTGCGLKVIDILKDVKPVKQPWPRGSHHADKQGHRYYNSPQEGIISCMSTITFCEECGQPVKRYDIKTFEQKHDEGRAEILVSGYKCSNCGFDVDY